MALHKLIIIILCTILSLLNILKPSYKLIGFFSEKKQTTKKHVLGLPPPHLDKKPISL